MGTKIPFRKELEFNYGELITIAPNIRRIIANNPSPFTLYGTGTYVLGTNNVAVIDPGPMDNQHIESLIQGLGDEKISHVFVTHTHMDHSPACAILREYSDADTFGFGPHGFGRKLSEEEVEEGGDKDFSPTKPVRHGDIIQGDGWSVECVHTPGHTSNHMCYQLIENKALFTGDHVMGWSTSIISPPDGDMSSYMASLDLLLEREDIVYWPTHGPSIEDTKGHVKAFIEHRKERERQIVDCVRGRGIKLIRQMVPEMYQDTPTYLYPAAERSVLAAIEHLVNRGDINSDSDPTLDSEYY